MQYSYFSSQDQSQDNFILQCLEEDNHPSISHGTILLSSNVFKDNFIIIHCLEEDCHLGDQSQDNVIIIQCLQDDCHSKDLFCKVKTTHDKNMLEYV